MKKHHRLYVFIMVFTSSTCFANDELFIEMSSPHNPLTNSEVIEQSLAQPTPTATTSFKKKALLYAVRLGLQTSVLTTFALAISSISDFTSSFEDFDFNSIPCDIYCTSDFSFLQTWDFMPESSNLAVTTFSATLIALHLGRLAGPEALQKAIKTLTFPIALGLGMSATLTYMTLSEFETKRVDGFPASIQQNLSDAQKATLAPAILGFMASLFDGITTYEEFKNA